MPLVQKRFPDRVTSVVGHLRRRRVVGASVAALAARRAQAQSPWPDRPVRMLVGLPPGGQADLLARGLAPHFQGAFGQPFVVENRPGAGGTIAAAAIAQATDRHTIGFVLGGPTTTARTLNPALPYDPATAFTAISLITRVPFVLTLHPDVPARSWPEFVALARARPGRLTYASIGPGTVTHVAMEELKGRLGLEIEHVPYSGFPAATLDLVAGRVHAMFNVPSAALPHIRQGGLVALVQTGESRLAQLPEVPTLEEAGVPDASFFGWTGIVAPAGFPPDAARRIADVARDALARDPAARGGLDLAGSEILGTPPAALEQLQRREAARWNAVIQRLGLRAGG
jgi:tripartite-type tricarboxylate transporter receptor subunit TctC